ncbi:primosomal protein N' (replication factor Y) - superfamily II helicase [Roseitranquillus sediminis]|uniref:primosomal protein N' (replication factor Y) - superfamily II helicase n=1 Tax=Roseitranquillus sediminis TaxID=2809051 RepID=UPI001D0C346B|nr:primosomal protein N' (replication factor Y) - superfamily II helicase [Roseitranquillus sediminis]MBM9594790.1 primosomal protein N' (replication factor Y) - superfamily II helicase [Roseitranquillus sediminis]
MTEDHRFPCGTCGSDMRFEPRTRRLVCPHCGNSAEIENRPADLHPLPEHDFRAALDARLPQTDIEETRTRTCQSCGATVEFDEALHARECPFCATPIVTDTGLHRHIKPGGLLPFEVDEAAAHQAMTEWLGSLWLAPNGLRDYARKGRRMSGVYVPYWTFDARTETHYRGERGTTYVEMRTVVRDGKRQSVPVTKVRWRAVTGRVARTFDDVLVLASRSLPKKHTGALPPWDLSRLSPYAPEFIAGFRAEAYRVELADAFVEARDWMDRVIERDVRFDIGGDRQRIHQMQTQVDGVTFKHVLLPVWVAAYKYRGESYRFVVNGQTGRVQGERPWSPWKVALAVLLAVILAAVAGYFGALQS